MVVDEVDGGALRSYSIAVASHRRASTLASKTLALLGRYGLLDRVTVFVLPFERSSYETIGGVRIADGGVGMDGQMNAIRAHYPDGHRVVQIDDDVREVVRWVDSKKVEPVPDIGAFFEGAFAMADRSGVRMWGLSPSANPFYMGATTRAGLYFCDGTCHGFANDRSDYFATTVPVKTDYERTLLAWSRDGAVVRFDRYAVQSSIYKEPGGLQSSGTRSAEAEERAVASLESRWPGLVARNPARKSGHLEIKLKPRKLWVMGIDPCT